MRLAVRVGASSVHFDRHGGRLGAATLQLSASRTFTPRQRVGVEVAALALVPTGAVLIQPACVPGGFCPSTETPHLVAGALIAPFVYAGTSPIRLSLGAGPMVARGGTGFGQRATLAFAAGVDYLPRRKARLVPTVGLRAMRLSTGLAGARHLLLPSAGLAF